MEETLEERAARCVGKEPTVKDREFLYDLQSTILHLHRQRQEAIIIFNSLPLEYRKFAFTNYEGSHGLIMGKDYTLKVR